MGAKGTEWDRITTALPRSVVQATHASAMDALNDERETDNLRHIVDELRQLSICECLDQYGNVQRASRDVTGVIYRLIANKSNTHTDFLRRASEHDLLKPYTRGLAFYNTESRVDPLMKTVHLGYQGYLYQNMWKTAAEHTDVPKALARMGISQYGCMLFHDLEQPQQTRSTVASLSDIYGPGFPGSLSRLSAFKDEYAVKKAFPAVGAQGVRVGMARTRGLGVLEREVRVMYAFRSAIIHGDVRPYVPENQEMARSAYNALDALLAPLLA